MDQQAAEPVAIDSHHWNHFEQTYVCPGDVCGAQRAHSVYLSACSFLLALRLKGSDIAFPPRIHLCLFVHPSNVHGLGLFATLTGVKRGELIGEYVGERITKEQCNDGRVQDYIVGLGRGRYIDGNCKHNLLRFINHASGENANCRSRQALGCVRFYAKRDIPAGQELLYDYGYDPKTHDYVYV